MSTDDSTKVAGIGGVFLKANDPAALAAWYSRHFGLQFQSGGCGNEQNYWLEFVAYDDPIPAKRIATVFAIQSAKSRLPAERHAVEINYRVPDLAGLLSKLTAAGIAIEKQEDYDYGRFAWLRDPENNRVELYQPK